MCYVKYKRYLLVKIILYVFIFNINNFTLKFKMQRYTFHKLTYTYVKK